MLLPHLDASWKPHPSPTRRQPSGQRGRAARVHRVSDTTTLRSNSSPSPRPLLWTSPRTSPRGKRKSARGRRRTQPCIPMSPPALLHRPHQQGKLAYHQPGHYRPRPRQSARRRTGNSSAQLRPRGGARCCFPSTARMTRHPRLQSRGLILCCPRFGLGLQPSTWRTGTSPRRRALLLRTASRLPR